MGEIGIGLVAAALVALVARKTRALSRSGAIAATLLGGLTIAGGGWEWGALLVAYFVSSSALSKIADRRKPDHGVIAARGAERDAIQVLANGGIPGIFAAINWIDARPLWFVAFAAALAAAAADTWATEIGAFSKSAPRLITTLQPVGSGQSGAISLAGTIGSLVAALLIGGMALVLVTEPGLSAILVFVAVTLGGIAGSLFDSLTGATVQAIYHCPQCDRLAESSVHRCGTPTDLVRGYPVMTNDLVNGLAICSGVAVAMLICWIGA